MSRLIDELRASGDFPGKSARDLTLSYGRWLERDQRDDIFTSNPDFAQEYFAIKDDIARARRPGYVEEFKGAFGSAVDEMQASGYALGALAADGARRIGIPGAEPIRNNLLKLMREQEAEAAEFQPSVGSYERISGEHPIEDSARFATYALGTVAPSIAQAAISAAAGAGAGALLGSAAPGPGTVVGAASGALLGLAERKLAQKVLSGWLAKGIKGETLEIAAKTLTKAEIATEAKRLAMQYGGQAALAASSIGQEVGSIYGDNPEAPGTALAYGIPAGLLDVLPTAYIASRFLGAGKRVAEGEVQKAVGYFRRFAEEAAKVVPMEGTTEAAQTLLEIAAAKSGRGERPDSFTDADYRQMLNAGIVGAIGGLAMAPGSALANPNARRDPNSAERLEAFHDVAIPNPPMDFGSGMGLPRPAEELGNPMAGIDEVVTPDPRFDAFQTARPAYRSAEVFLQNEVDPSLGLYEETRGGARAVLPAQGAPDGPFMGIPEAPGGAPTAPPAAPSAQPEAEPPTWAQKVVERAAAAATAITQGRAATEAEKIRADLERARLASAESAWEIATPVPPGPMEFGGQPPASAAELENLRPRSEVAADAPLTNLIGSTVEYQGYRGTLVRDEMGNFMVLPPVRNRDAEFWVEVAGTGKNGYTLASSVGVVPTEAATYEKPAPGVAVPQPTNARAPGALSKVPLGDLFPPEPPLAPRADLNPQIFTQPGQVAAMQAQPPPVVAAPPVAPAPAPVAATPKVAPATQEVAPSVPPVPVPVIAPTGVVTQPTAQQVIAATNGVPVLADEAPNIARMEFFLKPRPEPRASDEGGPTPLGPKSDKPLGSESRNLSPLASLKRDVGKRGQKASNTAAVIVDNATDQVFVRHAYIGDHNEIYLANAQQKVGREGKIDFLGGGVGLPISRLENVLLPDGSRRYRLAGIATLTNGKVHQNFNVEGGEAGFLQHPGLARAQRAFNEHGRIKPTAAQSAMPPANSDLEAFPKEMAAWRRENPGAKAGAEMAARVGEYNAVQNRKAGGRLNEKELAKWTKSLTASIETMAAIEQKQAVLLSADYIGTTASTIDLFRSTLRALTESRGVDVAAFEGSLASIVDSDPGWFNGSQAIGLDGTPLELYHGSFNNFADFDPALLGSNTGTGSSRMGFFFTTNQAEAESYASNQFAKIKSGAATAYEPNPDNSLAPNATIYRANLSLKNPLIVDRPGLSFQDFTRYIRQAKEARNDGVIFRKARDMAYAGAPSGGDTFVVFDPHQIRAVGSWDNQGVKASAARTTGLVFDPGTGRKVVAFGLSSINGPVNADAIISLLHETAHVITDGLSEPLRVAFQEAIGRMSWQARERTQSTNSTPEFRATTRTISSPPAETAAFKAWFGKSRVVDSAGKPRAVYHGSGASFDQFLTTGSNDVGAHFSEGTRTANYFAAQERNEDFGRFHRQFNGAVYPVFLSIKNPLQIRDLGNWDIWDVANELNRVGLGTYEEVLAGIRAYEDRAKKNYPDGWNSRVVGNEGIVGYLKSKGYDGVKYLNRHEVTKEGEVRVPADRAGELKSAAQNRNTISDSEFKEKFPDAEYAWIAFDPSQIKSATGNQGTFDPSSGDIRLTTRVQAGWLMNPRSLDIRLLANADPAQLSPEQRAALERLTPEEIAAARRIDPAALIEEQMAEHLAQLGWDRSEAKGVVQKLIRFVKELWLRMAMAIQTALKGADNLNPALARAYVENRFLQFIHRDSAYARDRINDLLTWIGAPATPQQTIPVFPAGNDWDQRMQFVDVATGEIIPVKTANYTPDAQTRAIKLALDRAAQWVAGHPVAETPDTPELRFTRRAFFAAPFSSTPTIQLNKVFAQVNLESEIYRTLMADGEIGPLLPRPDGQAMSPERFAVDWLKLPQEQTPASRKQGALKSAQQPDPLTGQPIAHEPDTTVDALPSVEQKITDREGKPKVVQITEAQDDAIKMAILSLRDTWRRVVAQAARDGERFAELTRDKERAAKTKGDFSAAAQYELSRLGEEVLTRQKIALRLNAEINRLLAKFRPGDLVSIFPGAELLSVPNSDATEEQIRGGRKYRVPLDLTFASADAKAEIGGEISRGEAWLKNPDNRFQGQIYGVISEQVRKLRQIPFNQERSAVSVVLRKIAGGFIDTLNASGLPSMRLMAKRFAGAMGFVDQYRADLTVLGRKWETAFGRFAEAMGRPNDQAFVEEMWDPISRVWNFVDASERGKLGTPAESDIFAVVERALKDNGGMEISGEKQREALRALTMASIERERYFGQIFDQHPELQVYDSELGTYRRLFTHGIVTGSRGLRREMLDLALRMNPAWSDTRFLGADDQRTFWDAAGDLYKSDRTAFDAKIAELFGSYVVDDFVAPLAQNNVALFDVSGSDGTPRKASILNVRQAWNEAGGDVTKFAEILHALEGGGDGMEGRTVQFVLGNLLERFGRLKGMLDKQKAAENTGVETLQRQMLDGREAADLPAQWVSYATMDSLSNLTLLHQLAMQAGFGPRALEPSKSDALGVRRSANGADPILAGGELAESVAAAKRELTEIRGRFDVLHRDGLSPAAIEKEMGPDDFKIAKNAARSAASLDYVETLFRQMHSVTNYLNTDLKVASDVAGLMSTMMLQNPRSGVQQLADVLGLIVDLKMSTQTLRGLRSAVKTAAAEIGNSVFEAFGQQAAFGVAAARRRRSIGNKDPETRVSWGEKTAGLGPRSQLATPSGYETRGSLVARTISRVARRGRDILPNIGSPLAREGDDRVGPKLTAGIFHTITQAAMSANIQAGYDIFADIATRGVEYLQTLPVADRAQFVRDLELGVRDLGADELGYFGGFLLNDKGAFNSLKAALETQMAGERSVGDFVAKAYRRMEAAQVASDRGEGDGAWDALSDSQFVDVMNYANSQWTLQPNFATLPAFMQGPLRPLFIFLTWPYLAMRRAARGFTDAQQRMTWAGANSSVADGLKAFFIVAAPATIAGSFAIDYYDERVLGKKQNLRDAPLETAIPVVGAALHPAAFIERWARYGTAGLPSDLLNMAVNYDSARGLSIDNRIVAVNAIQSLFNAAIKTPIQTEGNLTYANFGRPILQSIGGGGVLQYLQIASNLLGLDNQDAAINSRINTGNYLRAAGRELNLPVAVFAGPTSVPTPISPYLQQMELGALVGNNELFRDAYRNAVQAARDEKKENPEKYVADSFAERHPLKRLFKGAVSETDYRKMLGAMDPFGATQVRASINSFNRFLTAWFAKKAYFGKADKDGQSVEQLIRAATRINAGIEDDVESLLTIR